MQHTEYQLGFSDRMSFDRRHTAIAHGGLTMTTQCPFLGESLREWRQAPCNISGTKLYLTKTGLALSSSRLRFAASRPHLLPQSQYHSPCQGALRDEVGRGFDMSQHQGQWNAGCVSMQQFPLRAIERERQRYVCQSCHILDIAVAYFFIINTLTA